MKWHELPPKQGQLDLCWRLGIYVPMGATRGDVSQKITGYLALKGKKFGT
jgi:hypothetical protein